MSVYTTAQYILLVSLVAFGAFAAWLLIFLPWYRTPKGHWKCDRCGESFFGRNTHITCWNCKGGFFQEQFTFIPPYIPKQIKCHVCEHIILIEDMPEPYQGLCDACRLESAGASNA